MYVNTKQEHFHNLYTSIRSLFTWSEFPDCFSKFYGTEFCNSNHLGVLVVFVAQTYVVVPGIFQCSVY